MTDERGSSRPDSVFRRLLSEIISGTYAPGQSLPSERALSEQLSVSRSVLREALKRLSQLGLITTQHGGSSRTNDYRRTAGLDLLGVLASDSSPEQSATCWLSLLEMRVAIGADLARLCTVRASETLKRDVVAIAYQMADTPDPAQLLRLELKFWTRLLDGADNLAYRLAFNTMIKAVRAHRPGSYQRTLVELQRSNYRIPLAEAIARGDADTAEVEARASLRRALEAFARSMEAARSPQTETRALADAIAPASASAGTA